MKRNLKYVVLSVALVSSGLLQAGNPERMGQAGAGQLLINPYARNAGMVGANSAKVKGLEAQFLNIAGTAFTRKTEIIFNRSSWLVGSDININSFGITQGVGEVGTIGLGVVAINGGKIPITTEEQPEGGLGTFNPSFYNISLSYAKMFSDDIYGGVNFKILSEQIPNAAARGIAIDAGIQYHTGKNKQIHFGIALKNWGPKMHYAGDGLSKQTSINSFNNTYELTVNNRSANFELPTLINIGGAYDIYLMTDSTGAPKNHRLSLNATFTSNSFTYDNGLFGLEYAWKEMLMLRAGLYVEKDIFKDTRSTAFTGPAAGMTFELPFGEKKSTVGLDYSYRFTNPFSGVHTFGIRVNL
ncbi:MAG: PorV/PorQ family protein [Bacteroidia bacterium]|nr:PorV/PorQ family protein [Bacteroidia bacterium]